jgi:hypothetical protein
MLLWCTGGRPGIFVKAVTEGSAAAEDGRIQFDDQIIGVSRSLWQLLFDNGCLCRRSLTVCVCVCMCAG